MGTIAYARASDNIAGTATVTASAADAAYPAANLVDLDVAKPAKLTTTSGYWLLNFGSARSLAAVALLNHNLDAGAVVYLQANGSDSWLAPAFQRAFTIPADEADGFSVNPWLDVRDAAAYRYWRIYVPAASPNSVAIAIGEVVAVTALRALPDDFQVGAGLEESEQMPDILHESEFGARAAYTVGVKWKIWDGGMTVTTADDHWALARAARGRARPWLFVPDREVNAAYLVTFDWDGPRQVLRRVVGDLVAVPAFRLREVSRGVPL